MTGEAEFQAIKDRLRKHLLKYTRKAFRMLPPLDKPRILDIGCGSGVPTVELARLSQGQVIGLDIDPLLLAILDKESEKAGLSDRVTTLKCSMCDMDFPEKSFDIIWAEGSIARIGFSKGIGEWRRFLKPGGYLVVHDDAGDIKEKMDQIQRRGYDLLYSFILDEKTWWNEYYAPLETQIHEARAAQAADPKVMAMLDAEHREVEMVKHIPSQRRSVYFIMKKTS